MKRKFTNYLSLLILGFGSTFLASCSKDDPLPEATAGFEVVSPAPEVDVPVKFQNLSLNAARYEWDFGDGSAISTGVSATHTYTESGTYTVSLTAYNGDEKGSQEVKEVYIGKRYLMSLSIISISPTDTLGNLWDADGSGPDVLMQMGPYSATSLNDVVGVYIDSLDVGQYKTPIGISVDDLIPEDYQLKNEYYFILLEEVDTVDNEPVYVQMLEIPFNPVAPVDYDLETVVKYDDGTGFITVPWVVLEEYQFYMEFEIY